MVVLGVFLCLSLLLNLTQLVNGHFVDDCFLMLIEDDDNVSNAL